MPNMHRSSRLFLTLILSLVMAACGGGDDGVADPRVTSASTSTSTSTLTPGSAARLQLSGASPAAATAQSSLPPLDVTLLLDWAEREYPQFFPTRQNNLVSAPYTYRYYPATGNYVGVAGDGVFILGPYSNHQLTRVGNLEDFRCRVAPVQCAPVAYARSGWVATLSSLQHGVSGSVTIVDARTLRLSGFHYDGGGPQVFAYLGTEDRNTAYASGIAVGPRLNRAGQPYVNASVDLQLPEGQTLDSFNALSIWCVAFGANFGSGTFKPPGV